MAIKQVGLLSMVLVFQFVVALVVCANPSHKVLDAALAIHGKQSSAAWHKEASSLYENARTKLSNFLEKEQKSGIKSISAEDLGKTHLMLTMLRRGGSWLQMWGEPAGVDFDLRCGVMQGHLSRLIETSKSYPATQKYIDNFRQFIEKTGPARIKAVANIEKLCNEQKWPAAEVALFKVYDILEPGIVFLTPQEQAAIYNPFAQVDLAIRAAMQKLRSEAAAQELTQLITELMPKYSVLQQEMQTAIDSIAATGSASWRGEAANGPQLVEKIAQMWRETQVSAHQCRGRRWALAFRSNYGGTRTAIDPANPQAADEITGPFAAFSDDVMKSLVRLIDVDCSRATVDVARNLYVEYLRALAPVVRQTNRREWAAQLETALAKFPVKSPDLEREIKSYTAATSDLLRWRARVATAQTAVMGAEYVPIENRFHDGTLSGKVNDFDYIGLIYAPPSPEMQPQLLTDAPDVMRIAVQRLMGQKTSVRDVVRISADSKAAIARYSRRTYANLPAPLDFAGEVESLKTDLMVSEQSPPLTLAAMQAVVTAERGDLVAAGGEITGMHLEGVITRFATLPASAVVLTELGRLPPETFDGGNLQNMLMRFEMTPRWACHDYFFVQLAPPANLTAAR